VRIDGEAAGTVPSSGSATFPDLASGTHTVELGDVASNCAVTDGDERSVEVPLGGETVEVRFQVECAAPSNLTVGVTTSGSDPDPDGSIVLVNGRPARLGVEDSHTFADLTPDRYRVELTDVAVGCEVRTANPLSVDLPGGQTIQVSFEVSCSSLRGSLLFTSTRDGNEEIYRMNLDGSGVVNLTDHPADDNNARPSPDGTEIVFESDRASGTQIFLMDIDGSNVRQLTTTGRNRFPNWSPDGTKIVFWSQTGDDDIHVMDRDGTNVKNLTSGSPAVDKLPMWSPDGSEIVFTSDRDGNNEVFVMNVDGSNPVNLTNHRGSDGNPKWSPDGTRISFSTFRHVDEEVFVMNADGSGQRNL
ncbi:MAG: hypothetical protein R3324_19760, partial [Halobacteriales archaeon]|nr:hypothetical protein [Halobacteriales archaeon]